MRMLSGRRPKVRLLSVGTALALAAAVLVTAPGAGAQAATPAAAATTGTTYTISSTIITSGANGFHDLGKVLMGLRPGDTLRLNPGTYRIGYYAIKNVQMTQGRSGAPITITSTDPRRPALIYGSLLVQNLNYWNFSYLRFQAAIKGKPAFLIQGGKGWNVTNSEFWGARATGAFANVAITGSGGTPSKFNFSQNCVHGAAATNRGNTDHNVYVSFQGAPGSGGLISHNIIVNAPQGAGVKLGNGGVAGALGPWGVVVQSNTFVSNGRQILLHGNVRYNRIVFNLFVNATAKFNSDPRTTQIYVNGKIGPSNSIAHNYAYGSSMFTYDKLHMVHYLANSFSKSPSANPRFTGATCGSYVPQNPTAAAFGARAK